MEKIADSMCIFNVITQHANAAPDKVRLRFPPAIVNFLNFMVDLHNEAEVALTDNLQSSMVNLGSQKLNGKIQDNIDLTILNNDSFYTENCVACHHRFLCL